MRAIYSVLDNDSTLEQVVFWAKEVTRERRRDLADYELQQSGKPAIFSEPSSVSDLRGTEKVGDIAVSSGFLYVVVDNSGTLEWRRVALSTF